MRYIFRGTLALIVVVFLAANCRATAQTAAASEPSKAQFSKTTDAATAIKAYVVVNGDSMSGSWNSGDLADRDHHQLREEFGDHFAWFKQGGHEYLVTDAAVMAHLDQAMEPQKGVNRMQADVNRQQASVNALQAKVNAHQSEVNAEQHKVAQQQDQARVNSMQSRVNQEQAKVNTEQSKVNSSQAKVNAEQQRVSAEIKRSMDEIFGAALRDGKTKQLK